MVESYSESICTPEVLEMIQEEFECFSEMYDDVIVEKPDFAVVLKSAIEEKKKPVAQPI